MIGLYLLRRYSCQIKQERSFGGMLMGRLVWVGSLGLKRVLMFGRSGETKTSQLNRSDLRFHY